MFTELLVMIAVDLARSKIQFEKGILTIGSISAGAHSIVIRA
jgi:hypothetical protein